MQYRYFAALIAAGIMLALPTPSRAHCDTLDGPVVAAARDALNSGSVTPVLKWIRQADEPEVRDRFSSTLRVRAAGGEARDLADRYFFETVVRLHRAGEGAPYSGLKPPGTVDAPAAAADAALERNSADGLLRLLHEDLARGISRRLAAVRQARQFADRSVPEGRAFVAAYVEFLHYVEGLHAAARGAHPE